MDRSLRKDYSCVQFILFGENGDANILGREVYGISARLRSISSRTSDEKRMDEAEFEELVENLIEKCPEEHKEWLSRELKYGNEVSLRKRLKDIIKPFRTVIGNCTRRDNLINRIVNTRNYLTHYDPCLESEAAEGQDLWNLCVNMEMLFNSIFSS